MSSSVPLCLESGENFVVLKAKFVLIVCRLKEENEKGRKTRRTDKEKNPTLWQIGACRMDVDQDMHASCGSVCVVCMCCLYVQPICIVCMCGLYVQSVCVVCMCGLYVWSVCAVCGAGKWSVIIRRRLL